MFLAFLHETAVLIVDNTSFTSLSCIMVIGSPIRTSKTKQWLYSRGNGASYQPEVHGARTIHTMLETIHHSKILRR